MGKLSLVISILIHLTLAGILWLAFPPASPHNLLIPQDSVAFKIIEANAKPTSFAADSKGSSSAKKKSQAKPSLVHNSAVSYDHLLPNAHDLKSHLDDALGNDDGAKRKNLDTQSNISAQVISDHLNLPFAFREIVREGRATARINILAPTKLLFVYVDGDPLMRALLFESLQQASNARLLIDLSKMIPSTGITVSLRHNTKRSLFPSVSDSVQSELRGDHLIINRIHHLYGGEAQGYAQEDHGGGLTGIALPDKEAKRGRRRDKDQWQKLSMSPAFRAPIRNRDISISHN